MAIRQNIVGEYPSREPEVGRWLWLMQEARERTLEELEQVTPAMVDWLPGEDESSIGTILYHMAGIEADWLYAEVLGGEWPLEVEALFPHAARDEQGHLTQTTGVGLEAHMERLAAVRGALLEAYREMDSAEFRRVRSLPHYDVTPEWVLHHLMQHEAEHRSQIGALRIRAEKALAQEQAAVEGDRVINQGDIFWIRPENSREAELGFYPHPYVAVQENVFNHSRIHSVVVCALTTNLKQANAPGNVMLEAGEGNLPKRSAVVVSKVSAVNKSQLGEYVGSLSEERVKQILAGMRFLEVGFFER